MAKVENKTIRLIKLKKQKHALFLLAILFASIHCFGQGYTISGKVTDAVTGEPVPFASVYFKNLHHGTTTNFEGFYKLVTDEIEDSLTADYLGFQGRTIALKKGAKTQVINFQLNPSEVALKEVVIRPGENPAWRILRGVWAHKKENDKTKLTAYQYESYSKIELSADNISEKFKKSLAMKPFKKVLDTMQKAAGEHGQLVLPFFISETLSDVSYIKDPERKAENIRASKVKGVGVENNDMVAQLLGSSFQEYNFYNNFMDVLTKIFCSPISESGLGYYRYYLIDSGFIDNRYCYKIEFKPKREKDLAFTGTMWITDTTFSLKRMIAEVGNQANIDFIKRLKIQEDLVPTASGPWLPAKIRISVDISSLTNKTMGVLGKLYISNTNFVTDQPKPLKDYVTSLSMAPDAMDHDEKYWDANRLDSITNEDRAVIHSIDTINNLPTVKSIVNIGDFLINGDYPLGKLELGPYFLLFGQDALEGYKLRAGLRTNADFSRYWVLKGYIAAGNQDFKTDGLKYSAAVEHFISRKYWTKVGIQSQYDVIGLGVPDLYFLADNDLTAASAQFGETRLNIIHMQRVWFESDFLKDFNERVTLMNKTFTPWGYNFSYFPNPGNSDLQTNLRTTELTFETRYEGKLTYIINGNRRAYLGYDPTPIITFRAGFGLKNFLGGDFNYKRLSLTIEQEAKMGALGWAEYKLEGSKLLGNVPYPLLNIIPGNNSVFRSDYSFNMLNFFEFVTDQSVTAYYTHHFDGLFFNKIPLLRRLKWREVIGAKSVWGTLTPQNSSGSDQYPSSISPFYTLNPTTPYVEVYAGVENIFRLFRIDVIRRMNYITPGVTPWGIKGSLYLSF